MKKFVNLNKEEEDEMIKKEFKDILKDSINKANELEKVADQEVQKLAKLDSQDIHTTMIAIEKADLTFQTMMQIRNKIINAYEEIMRMQV